MNKLQGFYELQNLGLPAVPWRKFENETELENTVLWTVRTAVLKGNDFNLPRAVGVTSEAAKQKYREFKHKLSGNDLIIYYPFFVAEKSGIIQIYIRKIIIEACANDLWNLITDGFREVTYIIENSLKTFQGNGDFLTSAEIEELTRIKSLIRNIYSSDLLEGKSVMLEWSFAYKSNLNKEPVGDRYLVFYEFRVN